MNQLNYFPVLYTANTVIYAIGTFLNVVVAFSYLFLLIFMYQCMGIT